MYWGEKDMFVSKIISRFTRLFDAQKQVMKYALELKYQSKIGSFYAALKLQNFLNNVFKYRSKYAKNEDGQFEENL